MGLPPKDYAETGDWQGLGPQNGTCGTANQTGGVALTMPGSSGEHLGEQTPGSRSTGASVAVAIPVQATGLAKFASGHKFQNTTLLVIVLNGIWIGIDVEFNHPSLKKNGALPLEPTSTVVENLFCVYFTFEIAVRLLAFGKKNLHQKELRFWFIFDSVLVAFMVIETWLMLIVDAITGGGGNSFLSKFSTLRLLRLTRLTRLMHSLPELLTLVRGMVNAAKAVSIVLAFMVMIMYVFAIVFTAQLGDSESPEKKEDDPYWIRDTDPTAQELFGSMGDSMMSLFTRGLLCDNLAETLEAIKDRGGEYTCTDADENPVSAVRLPGDGKVCSRTGGELWLMWVFVVFMIISAMCLLNMLVGILCQVIQETSDTEQASAEVYELSHNIEDSFHAVDVSGDEAITKSEWKSMRQNPSVIESFKRIGVEDAFMDEQLNQIEEHLFARLDKNHMLDDEISWMPGEVDHDEGEEDKIPLGEFLNHILQIRPDIAASMLDLHILKTRAERDEEYFNHQIDSIEAQLEKRRRITGDITSPEKRAEEPNSGTSSAPDAWLRGLSTEALFSELRHRADLLPNSSPPAIDLE